MKSLPLAGILAKRRCKRNIELRRSVWRLLYKQAIDALSSNHTGTIRRSGVFLDKRSRSRYLRIILLKGMRMNEMKNGRQQVVDALSALLADSYLLGFKTHGYHWNVTGEQFIQLHEMFGQQYDALYTAADELAERIRALGAPAPASLSEFVKLSSIQVAGDAPKASKMIETLRNDHLLAAKSAYAAIAAASETDDSASEDMAIRRVDYHEKAAWTLGALLG